jgi:hypothetical protein
VLAQPVAGEQLAVQDDVARAVVVGLLRSFVQVWSLRGEHADDLVAIAVEIAVAGDPGDAVVMGQRSDVTAVSELPQREHRLMEAGQRSAAATRTTLAAFGSQQPADIRGEFAGHVEHRTIGDHGSLLFGLDLQQIQS